MSLSYLIHKLIDQTNEVRSGNKIGTTCKGIGPTYKDKYERIGIRMVDLIDINFGYVGQLQCIQVPIYLILLISCLFSHKLLKHFCSIFK